MKAVEQNVVSIVNVEQNVQTQEARQNYLEETNKKKYKVLLNSSHSTGQYGKRWRCAFYLKKGKDFRNWHEKGTKTDDKSFRSARLGLAFGSHTRTYRK